MGLYYLQQAIAMTKQLIQQAQTGNEKAFEKLYQELYDKVYGFCYKRTFDHSVSGDITANTFIKLIENFHKFEWQNEGAFYGWIFRICSNEVSNYFKKQNKYNLNTDYFDNDTCELLEDVKQSLTSENIDKNLDKQRVNQAMKQLQDKEKHIVELHYFAAISHKEIAKMKNMSEGNVRVVAHRAVNKLKNILSQQEYKLITTVEGIS